ncbi:MAG: hypothetical protein LT071_05475, partial [Nocardioides sp.]|nr:hypothetical protein [Nocardioides sp.]
MSQPAWYVDPELSDPEVESGQHAPALVTLHYLSSAVRRRWSVCAASALLGALLGAAFSVLVPAASSGTVTLMLTHEPGTDPTVGMATDVSLLRTRAVAAATVEELGLDVSPEDFHRAVEVVPSTPTVLVLTVSGRDDADAVRRAEVLAQNYLAFRRRQLMSQAQAMADGYQEQVDGLQRQVDDLTARYDVLAARGPAAGAEAAAVLTERSQRASEVVRLQQMIEDTTLRASAVVAASHVLDPASVAPRSDTARTVLTTASGMVGGGALGLAGVLFLAVTTGRLRRREEIGLALGVPVRASVTRLQPPRPWSRGPGAAPALGMQVLLHVLEEITEADDPPVRRMGLVATDRTPDAEALLAGLAARLAQRGQAVFVADLSTRGALAARIQQELRSAA